MNAEAPAIESPVSEVETKQPEVESNHSKALKLTRKYVLWSMGGGLIPVPFLDLAAIVTCQIKMLHDMAGIYGVEFKENRAKSIVMSLIGSLGVAPIGVGVVFSVLKVIPVVGHLAGAVSMPVTAGAVTYATGRIFINHFESGGTLLDFNAEKMKAAYRRMFDEGKSVAAQQASEVK